MMSKFFQFVILISLAAQLLSCKGETKPAEDPIEITANTILLRISKDEFSKSNMKLDSVHMTPFPSVITAIGVIEVPPNGRATVNAFMGGYVKDFPLLVGDPVRKGQQLLTLENLEFLQLKRSEVFFRQCFQDGIPTNVFLILHFVHNADDLIGIFPLPENYFRKPFAQ